MIEMNTTIQGKHFTYTVDKVLVQGRFGTTYLATRHQSDVDDDMVVIKTIELFRAPGWEDMEAFERESSNLRRLKHPYVGNYLDSAILYESDTKTELALVEEYVPGLSLAKKLKADGPSNTQDAMVWFEMLLETLVYLHHEHTPAVVHGDIDPGNIISHDDGTITLVDFATLRQSLLDAPRLASGLARGALDFAPMEQLLGLIFPASDLYAAAVSFLTCISNLHPSEFPIKEGMRIDVASVASYDAPDQLVVLLKQMTEPDPNHRLNNSRIALERLRAIRGKVPKQAKQAAQDAPPQTRKQSEPVRKKPRPTRTKDKILEEMIYSTEIHEEIRGEEDFWSAPPKMNRARVHAFGTNVDATQMVIAHGHNALLLDSDDFNIKGNMDFDEVARRVAVSRNGKRIAVLTGFEHLCLYDAEVSVWIRHEITVDGMWPGNSQLTFNPDGSLVAISDDDQVNIYRWDDGALVERYDVDGQHGLCFEPNGILLFAVGDDHTTIIDDKTHHEMDLTGVVFSPDGESLAVSRGNVIQYGKFHGLTPTLNWSHNEITIEEGKGLTFSLLIFSPNQRYLAAATKEGFLRILDLEYGTVLPFADKQRANDMEQVKLFDLSFGQDSKYIMAHATLAPGQVDDDKLGSVLSWSVEDGRFLGSLLWLDDRFSVWSAEGFYGEVEDVDSGGFSTKAWDRPSIALEAFKGNDPEKSLLDNERARLHEYHMRRQGLIELAMLDDESWDALAIVDATAGIMPLMPEVFRRATQIEAQARSTGYDIRERTRTDCLLEAAQEVQDLREDERLEIMNTIKLNVKNTGKLYTTQELAHVPDEEGWKDDDIAIDARQRQDDQAFRDIDDLNDAPMPREEMEDDSERMMPLSAVERRQLKEKQEAKQQAMVATEAPAMGKLQMGILSVCVGFLVPLLLLLNSGLDFKNLSPIVFVAILGTGPVIAIVLYLISSKLMK